MDLEGQKHQKADLPKKRKERKKENKKIDC